MNSIIASMLIFTFSNYENRMFSIELEKLFSYRRSTRKYEKQQITEEQLQQILEAAQNAHLAADNRPKACSRAFRQALSRARIAQLNPQTLSPIYSAAIAVRGLLEARSFGFSTAFLLLQDLPPDE
ncbi:MAG: nitroreductase family protein [Firmicutes bacterium]|nr:nitroreductase family protein [Bacillota bacterium]